MFTVTVLPTEGAGNSRSWTIATLPTGTNDKRWLSLGWPVFQTIMQWLGGYWGRSPEGAAQVIV